MVSVNTPDENPRPVLPIWATVGEAYAIWFSNLGLWLRLSITPLVVILVLGALVALAFPDPRTPQSQGLFLPVILILIFTIGFYLSEIPLATAWHRFILVHEDTASHRYLIGAREWRYLLKALFIMLIVFIVFLVLGVLVAVVLIPLGMAMVGSAPHATNIWVFGTVSLVVSVGLYAVLGYFLGYLLLMLPAAAIGRNYSGTEASEAIKGNQWRLVGIYIATLLPIYLLTALISFAFGQAQPAGATITDIIGYIIWILFAPLIVGALSITYRELVQKPEAAAGPVSPS